MSKKSTLETLYIAKSWYERIGKHYLFSFCWLAVVMSFAYLPCLTAVLDDEVSFFSIYEEQQTSLLTLLANTGFLTFVIIEYALARNKNYQPVVNIFWLISIIFIACIPTITNWYKDTGGCIFVQGMPIHIFCPAYFMHVFFLITLLVTRAETRRSIVYRYVLNNQKNNYESF